MTDSKSEGRVELLHVLAILFVATGAAFLNDKLALVILGGGFGFLAWRVWDHPEQVIGLLFTCFCAAPLLRRLHDFRQGWTPGSLLLVAPYVIFLPTAFRVIRQLPLFRRRGLIPMVVILATIVYAFLIGIWKNDLQASILGLLEWGCGPLVGIYILLSPNRPSPERLLRWVTTLAVVEVAYAFYQWIVLPAWDKAWLMDSMMYTSMGVPLPFLTRPWGTLNSTGPLAVFLVWFLIIGATEKWFALFAPGSVAMLVVTQVRAAWFTLGAGWGILFFLLPAAARQKATLKLVSIAIATLMIAFAYQDRFSGFAQRFQSIGNLKSDTSFRERAHLLNLSIDYLINMPEGSGLGSDGRSARQSKTGVGGTLDNGFIAIVMVLGWAGAASYLGAFLYMLGSGIWAARKTSPRLVLHGVAAMALLVANVFGTGFSDFVGVITFASLAMCYRAAIDPPPPAAVEIAT